MPCMMFDLKYSGQFILFNQDGENISKYSGMKMFFRKNMRNGKNNAKLTIVSPKFSPMWEKMLAKIFQRGISVKYIYWRLSH
jgi:hypothetical protein